MRFLCLLVITFISFTPAACPDIIHDPDKKVVTISCNDGNLTLRLNYYNQCILDEVIIKKGNVLAANKGVYTGITVGGQAFSSQTPSQEPKIIVHPNETIIQSIRYGGNGITIEENWTFIPQDGHITWRIERNYLTSGKMDEPLLPIWNFANMNTWDGALLDNGGVAWSRFLDKANTTYGCEAQEATFWNAKNDTCLRIIPKLLSGDNMAVRFSRQPDGIFTFVNNLSQEMLVTKHNLCRFLPDQQDVWAASTISPSSTTVEYELSALSYSKTYNRGDFKGVDGKIIGEILNTIARYGVIDKNITGSNGWRSGFSVLHEPWFAQMALAIDSPDYTLNLQNSLDYERDHAILPDGRVKSRFCFTSEDAAPGTYDKNGFYEAQWGVLLDSQADYVINVAELLDLNGNLEWARGQKATCEKVLAYMLQRDSDGNGLVEVIPKTYKENIASDWIDIVWASYENAYINAGMYAALTLWSDVEKLLGDTAKASEYQDFAKRLKTTFNKPIDEGGFWDSKNQQYVYWREKDGSIHGDNMVTPVQFMAIAYGLCDDPKRSNAILDQIDALMQKENLFYWPLCFTSYKREEVHANNWPFPRYENGDIFLAFGETAARAYAKHSPKTALKYIVNVMNRYKQDGLAHQRYTRKDQKGAGDDILANNSMPVVGLYRNIFGIQPKYNRLFLEPHLIPELSGTVVNYNLRDQEYKITLQMDHYTISANSFTIRDNKPFSVNITNIEAQYFTENQASPSMIVKNSSKKICALSIESWTVSSRKWKEKANLDQSELSYQIFGLSATTSYQLFKDGQKTDKIQSNSQGMISFSSKHGDKKELLYELKAAAE